LIGIPILVATLLFVQAIAAFERRLAWSLLDAEMPRGPQTKQWSSGYFWQRLRELTTGRRTWREVGFVLLRLPLGIVGFTIVMTIIGLMFGGFVMPLLVTLGIDSQLGTWTIDTMPEAFLYLPVSFVYLLVGPRILLGWGQVSGRIATSFLGVVEPAALKRAVTETLARTGDADAFAILDEMELRFGRGPFITPTRVRSTLLALEATGRIRSHRRGTARVYSLGDVGMQG
jgi:Putative sensor